jgi:hypothetical protein
MVKEKKRKLIIRDSCGRVIQKLPDWKALALKMLSKEFKKKIKSEYEGKGSEEDLSSPCDTCHEDSCDDCENNENNE